MISRGEPKDNQAKVKEHGLTCPVVLQQHWEISRRSARFATPIAYLIDEAGVIAHEVAVGDEAILKLLTASFLAYRQLALNRGQNNLGRALDGQLGCVDGEVLVQRVT